MMDSQRFWDILESAYMADGIERGTLEPLKKRLSKLPPEEIVEFRQHLDDLVGAAYKQELWGAAYLINGGCSDDGFHHFRCWLVGQGRDVYERALADPDSLADLLHGEGPCEAYIDGAPPRVWEEKTGRSSEAFYQELDKLVSPEPDTGEDEGESWDFDNNDEMRCRFPRLCRYYVFESDKEG